MTKLPLGIIAGNGALPKLVAEAQKKNGGSVCIAKLPKIDGDCSFYENADFKIGEVGRLFEYFRSKNVVDVVMAGGFKRPNLFGIKVDSIGAMLLVRLAKTKLMGDDKFLRVISRFFEENGFRVLSALSILSGGTTLRPEMSIQKVSRETINKDIEVGMKAAKALGAKDLGQSVIVRDGRVVGTEDENGTDALIKRCNGKGGVLVKVMKPIQDDRLDIPAIGVATVRNAASAGLDGIAIEADKVIVIEIDEVMKVAEELGLFLIAV